MKKYIENIRISVKKQGYTPTSDIIKEAINTVCPDGENILENKSAIVNEVIRLLSKVQEVESSQNSELCHQVGDTNSDTNLEIDSISDSFVETEIQIVESEENILDKFQAEELILDKHEAEKEIILDKLPDPAQEPETGIVVSEGEKHDLITSQSTVLDVQLTELETIELCSQIPDVFDDYKSFVGSVTSAIKAFVDEKFDHQETNTVDDSISELRQHIAARQARLDSKLAQGLNDVKEDLEQIRSNIKSRQTAILERFRIPAKT